MLFRSITEKDVSDQVDVLNETAISLSHQLESLNLEVANRMDEIIREKDFVNNVLNTAQAIILTQNFSQEIIMVNPYGCKLLGYQQHELQGMHFPVLLFQQQHDDDEASETLKALTDGKCEHLEFECDIRSKDNTTFNIVGNIQD